MRLALSSRPIFSRSNVSDNAVPSRDLVAAPCSFLALGANRSLFELYMYSMIKAKLVDERLAGVSQPFPALRAEPCILGRVYRNSPSTYILVPLVCSWRCLGADFDLFPLSVLILYNDAISILISTYL